MNSSDSAEEIIRLYLEGIGFTLKIAGEGSKNLIAFLSAMSQEKGKTKGKVRLSNMLKTGKELKIFTIKAENLKKFSEEAKKYGVLYCVLANKKNDKIDGIVDILVRQEDASKVNRIAERFDFIKVDTATIQKELEKEKQQINEKQKEKSEDEQMIDELLAETETEDKQSNIDELSPSNIESEKESQSENFLNTKEKLEKHKNSHSKKKSVKKDLEQITKMIQEKKEEVVRKPQHLKQTQEKREPQHLKQGEYNPKHFKVAKHYEIQNHNNKKKNKIRKRSR